MIIGLVACIGLVQPVSARAEDLPTSGMYIPELDVFDQTMTDFMATRGIEAGLLGIMKDGCIVYERGFGWKDASHSQMLPEDAMMRIASCGKPITAAAIRKLADTGTIGLQYRVFDLGPEKPGILDYEAFPSLTDDERLGDIKVQHLIDHQSGWDPEDDPTYMEVTIALLMQVFSPPGRIRTARYIMSMPLQVAPGTADCISPGYPTDCYPGNQYSNAGYMVLGLILEQESGMDYIDFVREYVFGPIPGETGASVEPGRTFRDDQNPREPWYDDTTWVQNVFNPYGPPVLWPYGGWDHEARVAQGGLIATTEPLLRFMEHYDVDGNPITGSLPDGFHSGSLPRGSRALTRWRADGVNYAVLFNKKESSGAGGLCADLSPCTTDADCSQGECERSWATQIRFVLDDVIDNSGVTWPTRCVDGTWVDFNNPSPGSGNFDDPFNTLDTGLANTPEEARMRIKDGSTNWAGTITQRVELHAPLGPAVVGQ